MNKNKVRFGLENAHYAPLTYVNGAPTFGTPVPLPGSVSLSISPNGETENFYADNGVYYVIGNNAGYAGDLELALIPEDFRINHMGETLDANHVLVENSDAELKPLALLFEFAGDKRRIRHALLNCTVSRTAIEGKTTEDKKTVQTEKLSIKAAPLPDGLVKIRTGDTTDQTVYANWFSAVYLPGSANAARLSALAITGVTLTPAFSAYDFAYAATTSDASNAVTATGETGTTVQILVNGTAHTSGESASWNTGINTVVVIVTKSGCESRTYTVNVTKAAT